MVASLLLQKAALPNCYGVSRQHRRQRAPLRCRPAGVLGLGIWGVSVSREVEADADLEAHRSLAYRPVVILPGLGNNTGDYTSMGAALGARGLSVTVAKVSRADWLRNAAGLLKAGYWAGTLRPRPVLDWYLERVQTAIAQVKAFSPGLKVSLIGHSAGGWLARLYLGEFGIEDVSLLLTLGSPHLPPPKGVKGVADQTRGLLNYIEEKYPGAFHAPDVKYVCISGRYVMGAKMFPTPALSAAGFDASANGGGEEVMVRMGSSVVSASSDEGAFNNSARSVPTTTIQARLVGQGYKQVCGQADVWGDGVVPEISAHLEGALNVSIDGVYHSPVGANDSRPWYGSKPILEQWVPHLFE